MVSVIQMVKSRDFEDHSIPDILDHKQAFSVRFLDNHLNTGPFDNRTQIPDQSNIQIVTVYLFVLYVLFGSAPSLCQSIKRVKSQLFLFDNFPKVRMLNLQTK